MMLPANFAAPMRDAGLTTAFRDTRDAAYARVRDTGKVPPFEFTLEMANRHVTRKDSHWRLAMAAHIQPWLTQNLDWILANPRHRQEIKSPRKTRRNLRIARYARKGKTASHIADKTGLTTRRVQQILNQLGFAYHDGLWIPPETIARASVARHKRDFDALRSTVSWVELPVGKMTQRTRERLAGGSYPIYVRASRTRFRVSRRGIAQADNGPRGATLRGALATLWALPLKVAIVKGYPAFAWENGLYAFLHHTNWLMHNGLWAKPYDGETANVHHADWNPRNCRPSNLVLLPESQNRALERARPRIRMA